MRDYKTMMDLHPSLIGTMSVIGATAVGAPVDTLGFKDVLATLVAGAVFGSGTGSTITLAVKIQECATAAGTGALWADITNGAINNTFAFTTMTFTGTDPTMKQEAKYERLIDANRLRFLRAHATLAGTVGLGPKFAVSFLLGRPDDTLYVVSPSTQSTSNGEFTILR
jgi:hypothetical protein